MFPKNINKNVNSYRQLSRNVLELKTQNPMRADASIISYKLEEPSHDTERSKTIVTDSSNHRFLKRIIAFFEEFSHMDEVRKSQLRVMEIKNQLRKTSDMKRELMKKLDIVRQNQHRIYSEMKLLSNRASERYLHLIREELEMCTAEKNLQDQYNKIDSTEFLVYNEFSNVIAESYEKEKIHTNFLKMLGVVGTILASFLTLLASIAGHIYQQNKLTHMKSEIHNTIAAHVIQELDKIYGKLSDMDKSLSASQIKTNSLPAESWSSFLKRHARWTYSWAIPNK